MSMRRIYRKIARAHGVSTAEVKREMQAAIDHAYRRADLTQSTRTLQESILSKGQTPTAEEFIRQVAGQVGAGQAKG